MFDTLHSRYTSHGQKQSTATPQEPMKTKPPLQRAPTPTHQPLSIQLWGTQVPPGLRLSTPVPTPHKEELAQEQVTPLQRQAHTTGLPDPLKAGVENLSGLPLDDVQVHYNSSKPAEVQALAYTQGTEIHVGPGQEQHLPHEAWHVVQQKQGRVTPTLQAKDVAINDDQGLEREASVMATKALQMKQVQQEGIHPLQGAPSLTRQESRVLQRKIGSRKDIGERVLYGPQGNRRFYGTIVRRTIEQHTDYYFVLREDNTLAKISGEDALYALGQRQQPRHQVEMRAGGDNFLTIGDWRHWENVHVTAHRGQRQRGEFQVVLSGPVRQQGIAHDSSSILRIRYNDQARLLSTRGEIGGNQYDDETVVEERLRYLGQINNTFTPPQITITVKAEIAQIEQYANTLAHYALDLGILS